MGAFRRTFRTHFLRRFQILDAFSRGILGESPKLFQIALCCPMSVCHAIYVMLLLARRVREIETLVLCHFESFPENGDHNLCSFFFGNAEPCRYLARPRSAMSTECSVVSSEPVVHRAPKQLIKIRSVAGTPEASASSWRMMTLRKAFFGFKCGNVD